jgi:hypothetical protein
LLLLFPASAAFVFPANATFVFPANAAADAPQFDGRFAER